jgi:uncharacterized repeat protein (TIGR01451 family)
LAVRVDNWNIVTAGQNQQFLVQIRNDGDAAENDVVVTVQLPPGSSLVQQETAGPDRGMTIQPQPGAIRFSPVAELPPRAVKDFRISVTTSQPGPISLLAEAVSRRQQQPVRGSATAVVER